MLPTPYPPPIHFKDVLFFFCLRVPTLTVSCPQDAERTVLLIYFYYQQLIIQVIFPNYCNPKGYFMFSFVSLFKILYLFDIFMYLLWTTSFELLQVSFMRKSLYGTNVNSHTKTLAFSIVTSHRSHNGKGQQHSVTQKFCQKSFCSSVIHLQTHAQFTFHLMEALQRGRQQLARIYPMNRSRHVEPVTNLIENPNTHAIPQN